MATISVRRDEPDSYTVTLHERGAVTTHKVYVPSGIAEELGYEATDEEKLVEDSFGFLLEREPPRSILRSFSLDIIGSYFPEWRGKMRARMK